MIRDAGLERKISLPRRFSWFARRSAVARSWQWHATLLIQTM